MNVMERGFCYIFATIKVRQVFPLILHIDDAVMGAGRLICVYVCLHSRVKYFVYWCSVILFLLFDKTIYYVVVGSWSLVFSFLVSAYSVGKNICYRRQKNNLPDGRKNVIFCVIHSNQTNIYGS